MPAGKAYPSGHLVPSPVVGFACTSNAETRFLELAISELDFSPRKLLGTLSILLIDVTEEALQGKVMQGFTQFEQM